MDTPSENITTTKKIQAGTQLDPDLYAIVDRLRTEEDRSTSNMIERLLKTHPRVQQLLETEQAVSA